MSKKHTTQRFLTEMPLPTPEHPVVKILEPRGNSFLVLFADGQTTLATIPTKFRKVLWIKRGNFVIVQPIVDSKIKITHEVLYVLGPDHIKHIKQAGQWPPEFEQQQQQQQQQAESNDQDSSTTAERTDQAEQSGYNENGENDDEEEDEEDDDELFSNTNRRVYDDSDDDDE
ncbi:uncharacterized protein BJ171DRAFT_235835 [Polychytrium aggregatum]|uniref:uncharacterized protein n=1 Tax=Polychytrium aggregatum TaxID=110093 RepID=UPI0022FEB57C|nr:uncharacterized protein BJ171DRAFT_235835 [Polychytrium aggregatum]KAI9208176.1 hypothetical protein BJ171DRAFT_235835 [Polychytrium aggregatum]